MAPKKKASKTSPSTPASKIRRSSRKPIQFVPFAGAVSTPKPRKTLKSSPSKITKTTNKVVGVKKSAKKGLKVAKGKVTKKTADTKVKKEKAAKKPKAPRYKNDKLKPRPEIEILEENPILYGNDKPNDPETIDEAIRLVYRWTVQNKPAELKKLANDWKRFPYDGFDEYYSPFETKNPVVLALLTGDKKLYDAIVAAKKDAEKQREKRPRRENNSLLQKMTTGNQNIHMLGHRTAKIEMTRGARQGNNALILFDNAVNGKDTLQAAIDANVRFDLITHVHSYGGDAMVYRAVRAGHRKLAAAMIEAWAKYNFNDLHINTLKLDKQPLPKFMPISTTKKGMGNKNITPVHTAAINPNVDYLKAILAVEPVFNQPDSENWYTIHYAAVCEGPGPLKYLIGRGAPLTMLNKKKESPLHCACRAGRLENVKLIISELQKEQPPEPEANLDEDSEGEKKPAKKAKSKLSIFGINLNAKNKVNETPLHYAVKYEHLDVVEYLLKQDEIMVDAMTSAGNEKLTPLILAAQRGNLAILRALIDEGHAFIDGGDKFKRTPLIHAVLGGQPHIVAELLHRGASINAHPDSSGNTAAHYASAYSWLPCLKLLEKAEPECLTQVNSWHLTPFCVAFLKNNMDIVSYLLDEDHGDIKIDVNDPDNEGNTLLTLVLKHEQNIGDDKTLLSKIEYLIDNGADVGIKNATGRTAFHYFASKPAIIKATKPIYGSRATENGNRFSKEQYFKAVDLLTGNKKKEIATLIDDSGNTVLEEALQQGNFLLAEKVFEWAKNEAIERWAKKLEDNELGTNIFHLIIDAIIVLHKTKNGFEYNIGFLQFFKNIAQEAKKKSLQNGKTLLWSLTAQFDAKGRTPLMHLLRNIKTLSVPTSSTENSVAHTEIGKLVQEVIDVARELVKVDKELVFVKEKVIESKKEEAPQPAYNNPFGRFGRQMPQKTRNLPNINLDYHPSAFELSLRFWLAGSKEEYQLRDHKVFNRNMLLKMMIEELKPNGLLERALLTQDESKGFKGYSPLLFCIANGVLDSIFLILKAAEELKITQKVCSQILEKDWDSNAKEYKTVNKSALLLAVEKRQLLVAKYLAAHTDLASKVDELGRNALHYLSSSSENVVDFLEALISRGAKPMADKFGRYPVHYAVAALQAISSTDISTDNLEYLIEINPETANKADVSKRLPIHYAFIPIVEKEFKQFDHTQVTRADPIGIVVVLLKHTNELHAPDIYGNTLVHYAAMAGANICLLTFTGKGPNINFKNALSNIPLGLAVVNNNESATMTIIQAGGDVQGMVYDLPPEPINAKNEKWKWFPNRSTQEKQGSHTILSLVVRNGWQGIIYVILDRLNNQVSVLKDLCAAAIEHRQFNLTQTLLKKLKNNPEIRENASIFFEKVAENCNVNQEATTNLLKNLFTEGISWHNHSSHRSRAAEIFAEHGNLQGLQLLKVLDHAYNDGAKWRQHLQDAEGSTEVLRNLLRAWKGNLPQTEALRLVGFITEYALALGDISHKLLEFNKPVFPGMEHPRSRQPNPEKQEITALIYAVQSRKYGLAEFLLSLLKVDVNAPDAEGRTPLMHAFMGNDEEMVRTLARMKRGNGTEIVEASRLESSMEAEEEGTEDEAHNDDDYENEASEDEDGDESDGTSDSYQPPKKAMLLTRKGQNHRVKAPKPKKSSSKTAKRQALTFKNSKINIGALDLEGKNALHYLIAPNGYENVDLVKQLFRAEAGFLPFITKSDFGGESPLASALRLRQRDIYAVFTSHIRKGQANGTPSFELSSELPLIRSLTCPHDFNQISKDFVERQMKENEVIETEEEKEKRLRKPHTLVQNHDISEIVKDDENGGLYKVIMHKTDVQYGLHGFHNYYRMELVQPKGAKLYVLFTNWGRIGDPTGQCQHTPFSDIESATKEFKSIFKAKSGNEWGQPFEEKPSKYRLVEIDEKKLNLDELKIDLKPDKSNKDPVYTLIKNLSNIEWMRRKWKSVCSQAANSVPFGQVKRDKVLKAKAILDKIRPLVNRAQTNEASDPDKVIERLQKIAKLSNEFYMELALGSFAYSTLPVIDNTETLKDYDKLIEQMLEFEIAGKLMTAAAEVAAKKEHDSIEFIKSCIECDIKLLDSESEEAQKILQYVHNSSPGAQVDGIYSILSKSGVEFYDPKGRKTPNHKYLWHGTRAENLLSILKLGLLATPPHAIQTGNLFGEGIYFADTFAKSQGYCTPSSTGQQFALLCEVALGKVFTSNSVNEITTTTSSDVKTKDTLKVKGRQVPNDAFEVTQETGSRMPLGSMGPNPDLKNGCWVEYNEYIVKDRSNVIIRYLVSFK